METEKCFRNSWQQNSEDKLYYMFHYALWIVDVSLDYGYYG